MKVLKRIIIIISIIAIIIFILLKILTTKKIDNTNNDLNLIGEEGDVVNPDEEILRNTDDKRRYYTVLNCVQMYLSNIDTESSVYYVRNEKDEWVKISENEIKQNIYGFISKDYIEKNNITIDNIYNHIETLNKSVFFVPMEMNNLLNTVLERYVIHGFITDTNYNYINEMYLIVNLDIENKTFSIEPVTEKITDINQINIDNDNSNIDKTNNNTFMYQSANYKYMSTIYFNNYKRMMLSNPEIAYKFLDTEYKEKRFGSLENYKKYVEKYKDELSKIIFKEYLVDTYEDYTSYVCKDQNGNLYIFKETKNLNYKIFLDEYTVLDEDAIKKYNDYSTQSKIAYNINKVINMVNIRDYSNFYKVLDNTFKNNNFDTEEKFEEYIQNNLFRYNKVDYSKFSNEGDIYIYDIVLTDATGENGSQIKMSVVMKLKEDRDFVMSFSIK